MAVCDICQRRRRHLQNRRHAALSYRACRHLAAIGIENHMFAIAGLNCQVPLCLAQRLIAGHKSR